MLINRALFHVDLRCLNYSFYAAMLCSKKKEVQNIAPHREPCHRLIEEAHVCTPRWGATMYSSSILKCDSFSVSRTGITGNCIYDLQITIVDYQVGG
jgi:hypothetical protein